MQEPLVGTVLQRIFATHSGSVPPDLQDVYRRLDAVPGMGKREQATGGELLGRALPRTK